ncbi:flagellar basal-body rod protein FlgG [Sulfitobacter sp. R18_1]|uniref:flagellar basal-body rod protein FlgG n=1 Tax=Sulfitobacter sp. R18_1 TaxID=2821104 RepID=UPI001ADBA4D9|nr:flagellar basal-body rod protein FlgG [Sulfitobacter sp. R18_1]MBO9428645.1 flagellar basal-body rod protein FlgG [Sulfitobacter sp. R18_1]
MRSLSIAATGMMAQQINVDTISNNIANMNTTGFKKMRPEFQDLLYQSHQRQGALTSEEGTVKPVGVDVGLGVQAAGIVRVSTQGSLKATDNDLDMAIDGKGYFTVNMPDGSQAYTRAGAFQLSPEGMIVTTDGYEISPGITVPEDTVDIDINKEGTVMAFVGNEIEPVEIGQINLVTFVNEAGMKSIGNNLLQQTPASGDPIVANPGDPGVGMIRQGFVENSNVDIISEITNLISAQRAYEMNSKAVETTDQMMSTATQMR